MFPTLEVFDKQAEQRRKEFGDAIPWRQLPLAIIYRIDSVKNVAKTKFGDAAILNVSTEDGRVQKVWATTLLKNDLQQKKLPVFVKPLGLRVCKTDSTRFYQAYVLMTSKELKLK